MSLRQTSFYITGGTLRHDAPSYVERQADRDLLDGLLKGEFCYVLTSRQMGKSSLMVRTAIKLREQGVHVIALDLTAVGQNLTPAQWYDGLVVRMGRQIRLEAELEEFWLANERLGPCQRFFAALRDVVLPKRPGALAIFVDEIDAVRSLQFSIDEFFAAIRECYNRRAEDAEFNRLAFCLLGVATPSDLIRDTRTTPFNIGRRIELHDFTRAEAAPLAQGLKRLPGEKIGRSLASDRIEAAAAQTAERLLARILFWTDGHPYLTQRFCRTVADDANVLDAAGVDRVCAELFLSSQARERDDNLLFVRERLLRSDADVASLLELYRRVRRGKTVLDDETSEIVSVLRLSGIVEGRDGRLRERNRIYARAFDEHWIKAHMPDAELQRQKVAFRRGVVRASAIAAVVVAALTIVILIAVRQTARTRVALALARFSEARTRRVSRAAGQRYESLRALGAARDYFTNEAVLRDEVIACLALMDLREKTNGIHSLQRSNVFQIELDAGVSAEAGADGSITIRRLSNGQVMRILPGSGQAVEQVRFGPGGQLLVAEYRGGADSSLAVWNWQQGAKLSGVGHGIHAAAIDFSADGRKLAVGTRDGRVVTYSLPEGRILREMELRLDSGDPRVPQAVRFNPSGDLLAECSLDDYYVQIWNLEAAQRVARLHHADVVYDLSWHVRGDLLATACRDSRVYLWNTNNVETAKKLAGHEGGVTSVAFNRRGTLLASLGDETLRLWVPSTEIQMTRRLDGESFDRLQFSVSDGLLTAASRQQTNARVWEVFGNEYIALQAGNSSVEKLRAIDFSPDSRLLAAASGDRAVIWDSASGRELGILKFNHANAHAACFSADSQRMLASTDDGLFSTMLVWRSDGEQRNLEAGAAKKWTHVTNELRSMAMTLDRHIAALVRQAEVLFVPLEPSSKTGVRAMPVGVHYHRIALHPDGRWMATMIGNSNSIDLWNLVDVGGVDSPLAIPSSEYFGFSPDGKWLVTCHAGKFEFYRVGSWENVFQIQRKSTSSQYAPIAFSGQGNLIALASSRYAVELLRLPENDLERPKLIGTLEGPNRSPLEMLAFSADGLRLAAATQDQTIQLWNLALLREALAELKLDNGWPHYPQRSEATATFNPE